MRRVAKITSKGQITLPLEVRRRLGVNSGDSVVFEEDASGVMKIGPEVTDNPFEKYRGIGHPDFPSGRKNIIRFFREIRGHDRG